MSTVQKLHNKIYKPKYNILIRHSHTIHCPAVCNNTINRPRESQTWIRAKIWFLTAKPEPAEHKACSLVVTE